MGRGIVGATTAALGAALALAGCGGHDARTSTTLTRAEAQHDARLAVHQALDGPLFDPACTMHGRLHATCTAHFTSGFWTYKGTVAISRTRGRSASPVDHFEIRGIGIEPAVADDPILETGRIVVPTRSAEVGQTLRLYDDTIDETDVELTVEDPVDPFAAPSGSPAPSGSHFVDFPIAIENVGVEPYPEDVANAELVLTSGVEIHPSRVNACDLADDVSAGATARTCLVFAVPNNAHVQQLQFSVGAETGVWRA